MPVYDDVNNQYVSMSDPSDALAGQCGSSWHSRKRTHQFSNKEIIWDLAGNGCEWIKENLGSGHQVLTAGISDNIYISQIANSDGGDADTYPLVSFDYRLVNGVITPSGGPFDETRKVLKDLFGPSRDYIDLNALPPYESFTLDSTQPKDDTDRDSGSYYGNLGFAQFEGVAASNRYTICRGGDFGQANFVPPVDSQGGGTSSTPKKGVVAGIFSVRMLAADDDTAAHTFRCVYRPLERSPVLDNDRDPDSEDPEVPTTPKEAPTVTAMAGPGEVTLSWTVLSDGGSPITKAQYQYKIDGGGFNDDDWEDILNSGVGGDNESSLQGDLSEV